MKIHVCRLDCQIDHVAEAAAGDSALQHVAIGYLARAEKAEAERDAATNRLYAIVNTADADCIRTYVGTEIADEIIAAERQRIDHYRDKAKKAEVEVTRLSTHVEELQAEALDINDGGPPEGTTTGGAILAIRATYTRAEKAEAEVTRLRASAVVWADDASPFTGEQVKALLDENERLRRALREIEAIARNHNEDWITRLAYEAQRSTSARKDSDG